MRSDLWVLAQKPDATTPKQRRLRTFNDEARQLIKDPVAEFRHHVVVVIVILSTTQLPPSLVRPEGAHKLPVDLHLLRGDCSVSVIAKQPREGVMQEARIEAAGQVAPRLKSKAPTIPRTTMLPLLDFELFNSFGNRPRID